MAKRDMTEKEFRAALERNGFDATGFCIGPLGYVKLPNSSASVSVLNARSRKLRDILAYLLKQKARLEVETSAQ